VAPVGSTGDAGLPADAAARAKAATGFESVATKHVAATTTYVEASTGLVTATTSFVVMRT
jgi:hypothetical protein